MQTLYYPVLFFCMAQMCFSEMPELPNYEELCEASELVVRASYRSCLSERIEIDNILYAKTVFEINECYKGETQEHTIAVLIPIQKPQTTSRSDFVFPSYQEKKEYFLFLQKRQEHVYIRVKIDDVWGERPFRSRDEFIIQNELKELNTPDRWLHQGDNLTYRIPLDAEERDVLLTEFQKERYLKTIQYLRNDEIVGERGWYKNGLIAYEVPYKDGFRHGIAKTWYPDGSLHSVYCYRKGRLHGYALTWKNPSDFTITFWIRGRNVSKDDYIKESKANRTLPKVSAD